MIGYGRQGTVYEQGPYAIKVTKKLPNTRILQAASDAEVSPRYHGTYLSHGLYHTVHDKLPSMFRQEYVNQIPELLTRTLEAGIYHNDLCTQNMMADASGCLKLIDFDEATWVRLSNRQYLRSRLSNLTYRDKDNKDTLISLSASQLARVYNVNK